mmetsp:Transcript_9210/g.12191  ORF Transcript_9210/g.12191 Transcript_9210/m.12191 type:complete len:104 (+) Transcript_9210:181-492(+)
MTILSLCGWHTVITGVIPKKKSFLIICFDMNMSKKLTIYKSNNRFVGMDFAFLPCKQWNICMTFTPDFHQTFMEFWMFFYQAIWVEKKIHHDCFHPNIHTSSC